MPPESERCRSDYRFSITAIAVLFILPVLVLVASDFAAAAMVSTNLGYDSNGNLQSDSSYYYEYNSFNQLAKIRFENSSGRIVSEYLYDYDGTRIKKIEYNSTGGNTTTYYFGDEYSQTVTGGAIKETYYYSVNGMIIAEKSDNKMLYYHPDHLGSPEYTTNQSGAVVSKSEYTPYGAEINSGSGRFGFTGQEKDSTGLMFYDSRYYSPDRAQFIQPDSMLPNVYDPQELNRYAYARNNPVKYTDPTGHILDTLIDIGFIIYDVYSIVSNYISGEDTTDDWAALGIDALCAVVPFATGGGALYRLGRLASKADDVIDTARALDRVADAAKAARRADRAVDAGRAASRITGGVARETAEQGVRFVNPKSLKPVHGANRPDSFSHISELKDSMIKNGFNSNNPIKVVTLNDGRMVIADGHHRTRAAIAANINKVPVIEAKPGGYPYWKGDPLKTPLTKSEIDDVAREFAEVLGRKW